MYSVKDIDEESYLQLFQLSEEQVNELQYERLQDLELESTLVMPDFMVYFLTETYLEYDYIDSKSAYLCPINLGEPEHEQQLAAIANNKFMEDAKVIGDNVKLGLYLTLRNLVIIFLMKL
jgi:hypothetical protein